MENFDDAKYKLELLRMSRELLNEEYINKRAEDHNKWVADADVAWKTQGIKLPYPAFAPYPKESEIVSKALTLYNFLKSSSDQKPGMMTDNNGKIYPTAGTELTKREIESVAKIKKPVIPPMVIDSPWATYLSVNVETTTNANSSISTISEEPTVRESESEPEVEDVGEETTNLVSNVAESKPLFALTENQPVNPDSGFEKAKNSIAPWFKKLNNKGTN